MAALAAGLAARLTVRDLQLELSALWSLCRQRMVIDHDRFNCLIGVAEQEDKTIKSHELRPNRD